MVRRGSSVRVRQRALSVSRNFVLPDALRLKETGAEGTLREH
jgi:hypothetical protein